MNMGRGVILLCAGRGSRMGAVTEHVPKCLLQVGQKLVVDHLLDAIIARTDSEVVAVTGFAANRVKEHVATRYGSRVATVHNSRFEEDVNILSVETGVTALSDPKRGYLVIETDLMLDDAVWDRVFSASAATDSFWLCKGYYSEVLTGGIVHANENGRIDAIEYQPSYDPRYRGWRKMVGILGVAPDQVVADRQYRQAAIKISVAQYYLAPWRQHLIDLPCVAVQVDDCFARAFNTPGEFSSTVTCYLDRLTNPSFGRS